ncbi:hypothetical protein LguiB_012357 [Lonicera macranthoides]
MIADSVTLRAQFVGVHQSPMYKEILRDKNDFSHSDLIVLFGSNHFFHTQGLCNFSSSNPVSGVTAEFQIIFCKISVHSANSAEIQFLDVDTSYPRTKTISKKKGSNSLHSHPNPNPKPTFVATSNSVGDVNGIASSSHTGFNNNAGLNNSTTQPPAATTINVETPQVLRPNFNATNPQVQSSVGTSLSSPNPGPSFNVEPTLQCLMPLAVSPINCSTSSHQAYPSPSPHHSLSPQSVESFVPNTISDQQCPPISNDNMPIVPLCSNDTHTSNSQSNRFAPLSGKFWGNEEEEPPIQSFEHSADEQFADTNALCVQLAADSDPSVLNQLTPENFKNTGYLSSLYTDSSPSATYNLHSPSDSEYIPQSPSSTPSSHSPDNFTPTIPLLTNSISKANKKHVRAIQKQKDEMLKLGIPQASIELCFGKETASKPASPAKSSSATTPCLQASPIPAGSLTAQILIQDLLNVEVEDDCASNSWDDPSLDTNFEPYLNTHLIKEVTFVTPIKDISNGSKIKNINFTFSAINSQDSRSPILLAHSNHKSYINALLANSSSFDPALSKNSSPSLTSESRPNTNAKRKRRKKTGSDRRHRKYWKKRKACSADLKQVLDLYHAEHISMKEAKSMLKHTLKVSKSIGYHVVTYIVDHVFYDHFKDLLCKVLLLVLLSGLVFQLFAFLG